MGVAKVSMGNPWGIDDDGAGADTQGPEGHDPAPTDDNAWDVRDIDRDTPDVWDAPVTPPAAPTAGNGDGWPQLPSTSRTVTVKPILDPLLAPKVTVANTPEAAAAPRQMLVTIPELAPKPAALVPQMPDRRGTGRSKSSGFVRDQDSSLGRARKKLSALFGGERPMPPEEMIKEIRRPFPGSFNICLINEDGGPGKTTVAALLGLLLATLRTDPVIAIDASPGCGDLVNRVETEGGGGGSVRSLVDQLDYVRRYADLREHTRQAACGLEVLGSDPSVIPSSEFTGEDYGRIIEVIRTYFNLVITDCAAGMISGVVDAVLDDADLLVIVSEGGDGVRAGTWTANYLMERSRKKPHYRELLSDAVVVVNSRTANTRVNVKKVVEFYEQMVRKACPLQFDKHLEGGACIDLEALAPKTYNQLLAVAAAVTSSRAFVEGMR